MIEYELTSDVVGEDPHLIARKVKSASYILRCLVCESIDTEIYEVTYDVSAGKGICSVLYGHHCKDCLKKIFKFSEKI